MNSNIVDLEQHRRIDRETPDERWIRDQVEAALRKCRLSEVRIANAIAEGKRKRRAGWPKASAAALAVEWALGPKEVAK